jgi:DNA repair photolyase
MYSREMDRYKGRGALSNPHPRFVQAQTDAVDDGWYQEETPQTIATEVWPEPARSIISRNDSPDIGFEQSINPYRGCEHGCVYCCDAATPVLLADGSTRPIEKLRLGDAIYGTERQGWYRRYVKTRVLAHWSVIKPAFRVTLADGTELVAGGDHRFLTERGWKHVVGAERGPLCRPHLTTGNKLMGTGAFTSSVPEQEDLYRTGYLCGLVRSEASASRYPSLRPYGSTALNSQFRLALCDDEALQRAERWLQYFGIVTTRFQFAAAVGDRRGIEAMRIHLFGNVDRAQRVIDWPDNPGPAWHAGFLAGIFDAEGSYSDGCLRIPNTDTTIIERICDSLKFFGFQVIVEHRHHLDKRPIDVVRLLGGLKEHLRFFHLTGPAVRRKCDIAGQAVKSEAKLNVVSIEPVGTMRLYDITTGTEDFIANGVVSHNCYARPSHAYMDLSPGIDFETKIFYKADAGRLLEQELGRKNYVVKPIALGANTDPYQPLERKLRVTRSILEVLERTRHPLTIVTKGSLILRDLDLLTSLARDDLVRVFVSVTSLDAELKRILEPRAASAQARLRMVRELSQAGVPTGVLVAPVIPAVNDSEIEQIIAAVAEAGALNAGYVLLRLPHELKQLFRQWLDEHMPDRAEHVMALIRGAREGRENDPRFGTRMVGSGAWAQLLRDRFALACKRHGLPKGPRRELSTTHFRSPSASPQIGLPL